MFAYIPARSGSKRVPGKNTRLLGGLPVLSRVVKTLTSLEFLSGVYVSTDDPATMDIAGDAGAQCLEPRSPSLSDDRTGFIDLMQHDLERFANAAGGDREVLFVLATAALVPPGIFTEARGVYDRIQPDMLMSCEEFNSPPWWALSQGEGGNWTPVFPEWILTNSQDLPPTLTDAGLFYMFNLDRMQPFKSFKAVDRMEAFRVPHEYAVDVDTMADWSILEEKFDRLTKST